ncbi:hypothetical protein [Ralstonia pseudosolanacearum]|uniref:hypothetical protein n=1 Tax=Ralstonia pseudosolanacearum TaxID=1310165 RepID=UPI0012DB3938|nr:hypothetical protein [Ralstonia pseudosolanacearum]
MRLDRHRLPRLGPHRHDAVAGGDALPVETAALDLALAIDRQAAADGSKAALISG